MIVIYGLEEPSALSSCSAFGLFCYLPRCSLSDTVRTGFATLSHSNYDCEIYDRVGSSEERQAAMWLYDCNADKRKKEKPVLQKWIDFFRSSTVIADVTVAWMPQDKFRCNQPVNDFFFYLRFL